MNKDNEFKCASCGKNTRTSKRNFEAFCFECAQALGVPQEIRKNPARFYSIMEGEVRVRGGVGRTSFSLAPAGLAKILLKYEVLEEEVPHGLCRVVGHREVPTDHGNIRCSRCGAVKWEYSQGGFNETRDTIEVVSGTRRISPSWTK